MRLLPHPHGGKRCALTLLELLIVVAILMIVAAYLLPSLSSSGRHSRKAPAIVCMNNLKQITLGYLQWQADHDGAMPWEMSVTNGGTLEYVATGEAEVQFRSASNYLPNVKVLTCPADKECESVRSYAELTRENLSYFLSLQAGTNPVESILAGDRNLERNGQSVLPGLVMLTSADQVAWGAGIHNTRKYGPLLGIVAFRDAHVEVSTNAQRLFVRSFARSGVATNRLLIP